MPHSERAARIAVGVLTSGVLALVLLALYGQGLTDEVATGVCIGVGSFIIMKTMLSS